MSEDQSTSTYSMRTTIKSGRSKMKNLRKNSERKLKRLLENFKNFRQSWIQPRLHLMLGQFKIPSSEARELIWTLPLHLQHNKIRMIRMLKLQPIKVPKQTSRLPLMLPRLPLMKRMVSSRKLPESEKKLSTMKSRPRMKQHSLICKH